MKIEDKFLGSLGQGDENMEDLARLPIETLLMRWVNYHLEKKGQERRVANVGADTSDSFAMYHVLNRLDEGQCPMDGVDEADLVQRANMMVENSKKLSLPHICTGEQFSLGVDKINTLFIASMLSVNHGLEAL